MTVLLIALGGALGSVLRYFIGGAIQESSHSGFPYGTLAVNVIGCIAIGLLWRAFAGSPHQQNLRALLIIGFCGGFTTFSTFSSETVALIQGGEWMKASAYVVISVVAGLAGTAIALKR